MSLVNSGAAAKAATILLALLQDECSSAADLKHLTATDLDRVIKEANVKGAPGPILVKFKAALETFKASL